MLKKLDPLVLLYREIYKWLSFLLRKFKTKNLTTIENLYILI